MGTSLRGRSAFVLAAAVTAGLAGAASGQIVFTPPPTAPIGGPGVFGVREVHYQGDPVGQINDQNAARAALLAPNAGARIYDYTAPVVNFLDSGGTGNFGGDLQFKAATAPGGVGVGNVDHIAVVYQGTVRIPSAGTYTFGVNSDDGFTLAFNNGTKAFTSATGGGATLDTYNGTPNGAFTFFGGRGVQDSFGAIDLPAGDHKVTLTFHEGGGGNAVELFAASGNKTGFDPSFALVGGQQTTSVKRAGTIATNGWTVKTVHGNNSNNLTDAIADQTAAFAPGGVVPSRGGGVPVVATANSQTVNFHDPEGSNTGGHGPVQTYPGDAGGVDDNNFSFGARATLTIPVGQDGHYTFLTYSDDSSLTRILQGTTPIALINTVGGNAGGLDSNGDGVKDAYNNDGGCCADILGTYNLAAGNYTIETISNEQGGGAGHFLYGAFGDKTAFDNSFQLIGENINTSVTTPAGLQLVGVPEPTTMALFGVGAVAALARRRRKA